MNPGMFSGSGNTTFSSPVTFNVNYYLSPNDIDKIRPIERNDAIDYLYVPWTSEEEYSNHLGKPDIYQIKSHPKGRVLLINNSFERTPLRRRGSPIDVRKMSDLWEGLGCQVEIKPNLTAERMLTAVQDFVDSKAQTDFCVVIVMSHGEEDDMVIGTDRAKMHVGKIVDTVAKCPALDGKPKLIFFQMCRGPGLQRTHTDAIPFGTDESTWVMGMLNNFLRGGKILGALVTEVDETAEEHIAERSDVMLAFATQPDHKSFRDGNEGSWFIQSIAKVFSKQANNDHVEKLVEGVKKEMKKFNAYAPGYDHHECVASVDASHTFGKHLYLFPGFPIPHKE